MVGRCHNLLFGYSPKNLVIFPKYCLFSDFALSSDLEKQGEQSIVAWTGCSSLRRLLKSGTGEERRFITGKGFQ